MTYRDITTTRKRRAVVGRHPPKLTSSILVHVKKKSIANAIPWAHRTATPGRYVAGQRRRSGAASLDDAARDTKRQGDMRCGVRGLEGLHRRAPARPAGRAGGGASRAGGPAAPRSPSAGVSPHRRSAAQAPRAKTRKARSRVL